MRQVLFLNLEDLINYTTLKPKLYKNKEGYHINLLDYKGKLKFNMRIYSDTHATIISIIDNINYLVQSHGISKQCKAKIITDCFTTYYFFKDKIEVIFNIDAFIDKGY